MVKKVKQIVKQKSWRGRMGVEPTRDRLVPPNGFEVREAHRDSAAPLILKPGMIILQPPAKDYQYQGVATHSAGYQ